MPLASILNAQNNLAALFQLLGRPEEALQTYRDVKSGYARLYGKEHEMTILAAGNYASSLGQLRRFEEAKALFRRTIPVARRVLGDDHTVTVRITQNYAAAVCKDNGTKLGELRGTVTTLEEIEQIARRVFGDAHPLTADVGVTLHSSRVVLRVRENAATVDPD